VKADDGQQRSSQHRGNQAFQVIGQPGQRQRLRVVLFIGKDVRDSGLESRREAGGCRLQDKDQQIDLPDLGDKWQTDRDNRSYQVQRYE